MPLWGNTVQAANSVKYGTELTSSGPVGSGNANKAANNTSLYANSTVNAFAPGKAVGQYGVKIANTTTAVTHSGWVMRTRGTGFVNAFSVSAGGTGYANGDVVTVSGGSTNATGVLTTNATGGIVSIAPGNKGAGFVNAASGTLAIANSTGGASAGSGANVAFTLGGRAGRIHDETIVAMSSLQ